MNLKAQLISLFFSFFYGICFYVITRLNHKFLFHGTKVSRIIFTLIYVIDFSLLYFIIISKINSGILHIYFLLSFVFGFFVTKLFLNKRFLSESIPSPLIQLLNNSTRARESFSQFLPKSP